MLLLSASTIPALAESGWRNQDGSPAVDTEWRKSASGFGGWLLITPDADWRAKWDTPESHTPHFNETDEVRIGETVTALIFFVNPATDDEGNLRLACDLRVLRPDGGIAADAPGLDCASGRLQGSPYNLRLAGPTLQFGAEPGDALGEWAIELRLTDAIRGVTLELRRAFTVAPATP